MSDGSPTPTKFDAQGAFGGGAGDVVLIRNHENRRAPGDEPPDEQDTTPEIEVDVAPELRYDADPAFNGGCTKVEVTRAGRVRRDFAVLGGTTTNCAGGVMPWDSWITCEEYFNDEGEGEERHGYCFEVPADATEAVRPVPIVQAGRFVHEAVAWSDGILYLTEDWRISTDEEAGAPFAPGAAFYRYVPEGRIRRSGQLQESFGVLQALKLRASAAPVNTNVGFPIGEPQEVEWVDVEEPDALDNALNSTRAQGRAKGAAQFNRLEGIWLSEGRLYFSSTNGGAAGLGQIFEYWPDRGWLTLVYESPSVEQLEGPDNLTIVPGTGDVLICEDADDPQFLRGLTIDGEVYDLARSVSNPTEFCGATFDPTGRILYVNQQGDTDGKPGVTYAITGPWGRRQGGSRESASEALSRSRA